MNIKLEQQLNKRKIQNFIEIILSYDLEIYQNKESKHFFHKYVRKVFLYENEIITIKIRRYFRYENGKKITYFLQQQFELFEKGTKFDSKFKDNIINLSAGMSYRGIF